MLFFTLYKRKNPLNELHDTLHRTIVYRRVVLVDFKYVLMIHSEIRFYENEKLEYVIYYKLTY